MCGFLRPTLLAEVSYCSTVQPIIPFKGNIGSVVSFALSLGPHNDNDTNALHNTHTYNFLFLRKFRLKGHKNGYFRLKLNMDLFTLHSIDEKVKQTFCRNPQILPPHQWERGNTKQNRPQTCRQDPSWHLQVTQTQVMFVKRVFLRLTTEQKNYRSSLACLRTN